MDSKVVDNMSEQESEQVRKAAELQGYWESTFPRIAAGGGEYTMGDILCSIGTLLINYGINVDVPPKAMEEFCKKWMQTYKIIMENKDEIREKGKSMEERRGDADVALGVGPKGLYLAATPLSTPLKGQDN